jgi:uncharacterized protein (TIGR03435 family)
VFRWTLLAVAIMLALGPAQSQSFEVASVRQNTASRGTGAMDFPPGGERFTAINVPLGAFILTAYNITAAPQCDCLNPAFPVLSEHFDIQAKAEHRVHSAEMLRLLQRLLEDRFKLVIRREIKELDAYALVVDQHGSKLHASEASQINDAAPFNPYHARGAERSSGDLVFNDEAMRDFAWRLSTLTALDGRVVVDKTGLTGRYDFELKFAAQPSPENEAPSIFTALREQLGLRLEPRKMPIESLTVVHAERPSEN